MNMHADSISNAEPQSLRGRKRFGASALALTAAAAAAFAVGLWAGGRLAQAPASVTSVALASTGLIPQPGPLHDALDQLPSGAERELEPGLIVQLVLSYPAASGVWCRWFELRAQSGRTHAVACRGADAWRIAALVTGPRDADQAHRPKDGGIIDTAVAATIDGEPLDTQDEIEVLVNGWQPIVAP